MQNAKAKQTCGLLRNHRERFQNTDFKVLSVHGSPSKRMQISDFISELGICVREFSQLEQNDISKFRFQVACLGETQVIDFSDFSLADFGMNTEFTIACERWADQSEQRAEQAERASGVGTVGRAAFSCAPRAWSFAVRVRCRLTLARSCARAWPP